MRLSQKRILNYLLILSVIIVILNDLVLNETPEIIWLGDELGAVLSNLSLAYIASYIFYYVVVVLKERKDKKNIYYTVYEWTHHLIGRAYGVYNTIISASGVDPESSDKRTISRDQFKELCNRANPNAISTNVFLGTANNPQPATYGQLIYDNAVSNVRAYTDRIFNYMPFLDSEHVRLINRLHSSTFFLVAQSFTFPTRNTDFSVYADNMYEFLVFVRELEVYNERVNKKLSEKGKA